MALAGASVESGCARADEARVWAALKAGGEVVLMRHTHVDIREGMGRFASGNCADEVNLSTRGIDQAKRIGAAFRDHGIAVGEVLTSPFCRCVDTGKLAFGHATPVSYLVPPGVVSESQAKANSERMLQQILKHRGPSNLVLITHGLNVADVVLQPGVEMGQMFVIQPKQADFDVVGDILIEGQ